ncbi:snRNA-activating protein of 50kDa MW C terminal-domain-containing protein [Desarmillaria tabescens]|uniref:snRNA-activating protein of 50kDa MW C terminal-domain-containing protein n=1 Tax=Armillaria tabescens TaxID=1929756 RepID=A0AA39T386_ARMTA|nr:snRNA-activating protein of 50kDa MW C terminal-domain-containing protein [Desarmillaria tabescens]KAK0461276.1 snRNA-activating protein of 50kDa MW C terminal-domain-containing protein [Desarmillaria tabescens]
MTATARLARNLEFHFGPPSEPIPIAEFASFNIPQHDFVSSAGTDDFSVSDIRDAVGKVWDNPELSAYILKKHNSTVDALYATQSTTKTRRKTQNAMDSDEEDSSAILEWNKALQTIHLSSYPLCPEASLFVRPPKNSDQNALNKRKPSDSNDSASLADEGCAIITVTIYTKGSSTTMRTSQHALLSSQALGDIIEMMPCASNDLPKEIVSHRPRDQSTQAAKASSGYVVCIGDVLYGDGMDEIDYADKMLQHLATHSLKHRSLTKASESMHDIILSSLSLRINEPYWILHQGNCEHFFVVDQIRLKNVSDPTSGYPFTLQLTPISLDLCRACYRIPAIWSIVGDLRLGESPCILCGTCWESMGEPDDGVVVVPFPKYELGW